MSRVRELEKGHVGSRERERERESEAAKWLIPNKGLRVMLQREREFE